MTDNKAQAAPQTAAQTMQRPTDFFSADEIRYLREISPWRSAFAIVKAEMGAICSVQGAAWSSQYVTEHK